MKKLLPWLITIILSIALLATLFVIGFKTFFSDDTTADTDKPVKVKVLSAEERVEVTSTLTDFRRNLKDPDYIVMINFAFQLDDKKTKEAFDQILEIEIKPIISRAIADIEPEQLNGSAGEDEIESQLLNLINPVLPKGTLIKVEITDFIISKL